LHLDATARTQSKFVKKEKDKILVQFLPPILVMGTGFILIRSLLAELSLHSF